jgi:hypothetical protein
MVIDDFNIVGVAAIPAETDPPLVVDPNTPLAIAVAGKLFQPVTGGNPQEIKRGGTVELPQLTLGYALEILRQLGRKPAVKQFFGLFAGERSDHA